MASTKQLEDALNHGYEFNPTSYFSKGFEYFKERAGEFIGYTIVYLIISMVIGMIPFIGSLISFVISGPLAVGILIFTHRMHTNQDLEFSNFFDGFKKFTPLFATYILQMAFYFVLALPLIFIIGMEFVQAAALGDVEALMETGEIVMDNAGILFGYVLLFVYIGISFRWSLHLAYFHDYSPVNAIKTSFLLVNKNWFSHFLFILLAALAALGGFVALVIGIIVAIPVISIADYFGYAHVSGLGQQNNDEEMEDTLGQLS